MSRWTVNPVQFGRNLVQACRFGASWRDRWDYLNWMYHDKVFVKKPATGVRTIMFRLPKPIGNLKIRVRDHNGSNLLVFGEVFFKREYEVMVDNPKTILDLGGYIGLATLYFGRRWPNAELAVVEPEPNNLEVLRENLENNSVDAKVFPAAVATHDGTVPLALGELSCTHQVTTGKNGVAGRNTIDVASISISSVMKQLGWNRISLLKIDIEGYEAILLRESTDWLNLVDSVCIEVHDFAMASHEAQAIAEAHGFQVEIRRNRIQFWTRP